MRNTRTRRRFELTLDGKQVVALAAGTGLLVAGVFILGMNVGRRTIASTTTDPPATLASVAPKDPLARLDDPLPAHEEPGIELKAHQVLTDTGPIDKAMPVPQVKAAPPPPKPAPAPASPAPQPAKVATATPAPKPATPTASPAPKPPAPRAESAPRKGAYTVQVASLPNRRDAETVARRHAVRGARVVEANVPGKGRMYRVVVGAFETQEAAKRALAALTRSGIEGIVTVVR